MKTPLPSVLRAWVFLGLAVSFICWGSLLIPRVDRIKLEAGRDIEIINNFNELERSIRNIEQALPAAGSTSGQLNRQAETERLYRDCSEKLAACTPAFGVSAPIAPHAARIGDLLANSHILQGVIGSEYASPGGRDNIIAEIRATLNQAIDEEKSAIASIRARLGHLSKSLAEKWNELHILVAVSCLLAIIAAVLLILSERQIARRRTAERALCEARDQLEQRVQERTVELAAANHALQQSEEQYRKFFDDDLAGAFICDPEGKIIACNPAFAEMFGFEDREDAKGRSIAALWETHEDWLRFLNLIREAKTLHEHSGQLRRQNGKPVDVVANVTGSFDEQSRLTELRGFVIDSSEPKKLEEQLRQSQKMEAVGRLAGGVAHDFNNLLTAITGYSELILAQLSEGDTLYEEANEIRKACSRASSLTKQLLALSRKQTVQPQRLELNAVVADMENMMRRLTGENIDFVCRLDESLYPIKADRGQMEQVLLNLVVNARDAMRDGGKLTIETSNVLLDASYAHSHREVKPGPHVMLAVSDTGTGMETETLSHVFEPFFTTKGSDKGTGLGLSIVYGIVAQSGGHIWVYSEPGKGTAFRIYFPRHAGSAEYAEQAGLCEAPCAGSETILIVEDKNSIRELIRRVLESGGYTVLEASDPPEALSICESYDGAIDLVLADVILPGMNGPELAAKLAEIRPSLKVLYTSGFPTGAIVRHGVLEADANFLQKPFTKSSLAIRVREALGGPAYAARACKPPSSLQYSQ